MGRSNAGTWAHLRPTPVRPAAPKAGPCRQPGHGSSRLSHHGNGQSHDHPVQQTDSRNSTGPPVARGRFVPCWWSRFTVESTETDQSTSPRAAADTAARPGSCPMYRRRYNGGAASKSSATDRTPREHHAKRSPPIPVNDSLHDPAIVTERTTLRPADDGNNGWMRAQRPSVKTEVRDTHQASRFPTPGFRRHALVEFGLLPLPHRFRPAARFI